jgi:hypothetical protein
VARILKQGQLRGIPSNKANAASFAANVLPVIERIKASGGLEALN